MDNFKYIIINEKKEPQHSLDKTYTYEEVKDYDNLAVLIDEPYVVLDMDNGDEAVALFNIIDNLNIKTKIMKTDRGCHFWFKIPEPLKNSINANTAITLKVDIKSWGKKSMVTVKRNGAWREWLRNDETVDQLPFWITPLPKKIHKDLFNFGDGDGRDDGLFTYIIPLIGCKYSKNQIRIVFELINKYIFASPLLPRELDKMFDKNSMFDETVCFFEKGQFLHDEFSNWLNKEYPIKYYNGKLYTYKDGLYSSNILHLQELMIQKIPRLKSHQRQEVLNYLELLSIKKASYPSREYVNCLSGMIDIEKEKLIPHTDTIFSINQINTYYDPEVYDKRTDEFLNEISQNDTQIRALLEEMIGYCLLSDCRFQTAFILLGQGANGKSIFLQMLMNFLGEENISSIPLETLNARFQTAELVDKLANIGDDVSGEFLSDSSIFKKLVTGNKITVERKNKDPFQFNNISKLIFSANHLPSVSDKSYGFSRRLMIIPFLNIFKPGDKQYDPNLLTKISTESAKMYLLNIAIKAINRVIKQGAFSACKAVEDLVEAYQVENNNCIQFLEENKEIYDIDIAIIYRNYCLFCAVNNSSPYKRSRFLTEVQRNLPGTRLKNTTRQNKFTQVFIEK